MNLLIQIMGNNDMTEHNVTLIKGDGIADEIAASAMQVIESTGININWDIQPAGAQVIEQEGTPLPQRVLDSVKRNKVALKTPVTTPIGKGFRSVNVQLRKELNLYANLRPCKNIDGIKTPFSNVDLVVVRENTEDLYAGIERQIDENTAESIKIITREASLKIAKFALEYAVKNSRKTVWAVTKANICKLTDGLFLECCREVSKDYSDMEYKEILVDNLCMQLVQNPEKFDVLVLPNLYGDIVSDLTAGLIGGLGVASGANIGDECAVFEPVHGSAPDIAGQDKANPTALILCAVEMLKYLNEFPAAKKIEKAVYKVLKSGIIKTFDLGGSSSCSNFTKEIIKNLN